MIGLYDWDFVKAGKTILPAPSINCMKMGTYLKNNKVDFKLISSPKEIATFEKVYFFSNDKLENIPKEIFSTDITDIEMYGDYLGGKLPTEILFSPANINMYAPFIEEKVNTKKISATKAIHFLDAYYHEAKVNGLKIPLPPMMPRKKIVLYDKDFLGYEDCWDLLDEMINEKRPSTISMIYPLKCKTITQFLKLREDYDRVKRSDKIILDYYVPMTQFDAYFGKYKLKLLGEVTTSADINVYIGKNYLGNVYGDAFYVRNLLYCINLIYSYYSRNIQIKAITYENLTSTNSYAKIYKDLQKWTNTPNRDIKLIDYIISKKDKETYENLVKTDSTFSYLFNISKNDLINTRGIWRIV